jgi:membrane protein YqaA with SNARE-associated domain
METWLTYFSLFAVSFVGATLITAPADLMVFGMAQLRYDALAIVTFATIGSVLGSIVNYVAGKYGVNYVLKKIATSNDRWYRFAERLFERGSWMVFFAWMPFIGDPLTIIAGTFKMQWWKFFTYVYLGKVLKYSVITVAVQLLH